jgi:hypothetical protein
LQQRHQRVAAVLQMLPPARGDFVATLQGPTAARWTKTGAQEVLNSMSLPMAWVSAGGNTSQPRRQPVMRKLLEKLCATISRSSGSATSRKLLAAPLALSPA